MENVETKKNRKDKRIGLRVFNKEGTDEETKARRK